MSVGQAARFLLHPKGAALNPQPEKLVDILSRSVYPESRPRGNEIALFVESMKCRSDRLSNRMSEEGGPRYDNLSFDSTRFGQPWKKFFPEFLACREN